MSNAARRRGVKINENLFDINTAASEGFGHDMGLPPIDIATKQIIKAKALDIFSVQPNPIQPRRVVPSKYRQGSLVEQIEAWRGDVAELTGRRLPLEGMVRGEVELRMAEGAGDFTLAAEELPLLRLADLAASIHQDGLTNPITVVKADENFLIETGERRWAAYHLLNDFVDGDAYKAIPARRMRELNLWRQASENAARDTLNAIARARQVALLLMDIHGWQQFAPIQAFDHEQDFYAQVADARAWRIPYGKAEQLCLACGFENPSRIRQYRALLKLPRAQWLQADDHSIPESELRKWLAPPKSATAVRDSGQRKSSKIPAALQRFERQLTKAQFQRLDADAQRQTLDWMKAQVKRMENWHRAK